MSTILLPKKYPIGVMMSISHNHSKKNAKKRKKEHKTAGKEPAASWWIDSTQFTMMNTWTLIVVSIV
jgi:hypothetical protein